MKKALWRKAFPEMPPVYLSIYKIYTNYKNLQSPRYSQNGAGASSASVAMKSAVPP